LFTHEKKGVGETYTTPVEKKNKNAPEAGTV
jgi:hypothetical protein